MLGALPGGDRITVGGDKNYNARDFVRDTRELGVTPHVAQYPNTTRRGSAVDGRMTRHAGYAISQRKRKLVQQAFRWMKTVCLLRTLYHRGRPLVHWTFTFHAAAYNLVRLRTLLASPHDRELVRGHGDIAIKPATEMSKIQTISTGEISKMP